MKIIALDRRYKNNQLYGHTAAIEFSRYWQFNYVDGMDGLFDDEKPEPIQPYEIEQACTRLLGEIEYDQLDRRWSSYFAQDGRYYITFQHRNDILMVLMSIEQPL